MNAIMRATRVTRLTRLTRLTQSREDVLAILNMSEIINGKAIDEAIEFQYYDSKTHALKELAKDSNYTVSALGRAYQAYKGELTLRTALKAKQNTAENEAKLKGMSDNAKRELAKGTTTKQGMTVPEAVELALTILEKLSPKATAKEVVEVRAGKIIHKRAFTMLVRSEVYLEAKGLCNNCEKFITIDDYECDHIVPHSKGGTSTKDNAQALCRHCNRAKGNYHEQT